MENEPERVRRCPRCFGRDVRPSRKGGFLDSIMAKLRRTPFRCRGCSNRFYVYIPREKDDVQEPEEGIENPEAGASQPKDQAAHKSDVAKPAEP